MILYQSNFTAFSLLLNDKNLPSQKRLDIEHFQLAKKKYLESVRTEKMIFFHIIKMAENKNPAIARTCIPSKLLKTDRWNS